MGARPRDGELRHDARNSIAVMPSTVPPDRMLLHTIVFAVVLGALLAMLAWWIAGVAAPDGGRLPRATVAPAV